RRSEIEYIARTMCHFVTATVPGELELPLLARVFEKHNLGFRLLSSSPVVRQLPAGDRYVLTTRGHCDCGTVLGSRRTPEAESRARQVAKLRKKGWGDAKIERWLAEKQAVRERDVRKPDSDARARTADVERWLAFVDDALALVPRVGLLLHFYGGDI